MRNNGYYCKIDSSVLMAELYEVGLSVLKTQTFDELENENPLEIVSQLNDKSLRCS